MKNKYDEVVEEYQYLVYKLAKRLYNGKTEYDDLVQAGFLGLIKAIEHYNPFISQKFLGFASKYIIYEMKKEFRKNRKDNPCGLGCRIALSCKRKSRRTGREYRRCGNHSRREECE